MGLFLAAAAVAVCAIVLGLLSNFNWRSYHKGELSGPQWVWPIVGATLHCIMDPYGYWITQRSYGKLSWNSLFGKFLILAGDVASCRSVLTQTGYVNTYFHITECTFPPCSSASLPQLRKHGPLRQTSWAVRPFLSSRVHAARSSFLGLLPFPGNSIARLT